MENATAWWKKETWTKDEVFTASPLLLNMIVVKLNGGGLLLYAPVKMHKEAPELLLSWLESLGPVQWIVVASAAHTLLIHDAVKERLIFQLVTMLNKYIIINNTLSNIVNIVNIENIVNIVNNVTLLNK